MLMILLFYQSNSLISKPSKIDQIHSILNIKEPNYPKYPNIIKSY